mgnify:CR=1 FL=1
MPEVYDATRRSVYASTRLLLSVNRPEWAGRQLCGVHSDDGSVYSAMGCVIEWRSTRRTHATRGWSGLQRGGFVAG